MKINPAYYNNNREVKKHDGIIWDEEVNRSTPVKGNRHVLLAKGCTTLVKRKVQHKTPTGTILLLQKFPCKV